MGSPAAAALRMILSSTSVMFMTCWTAMPCCGGSGGGRRRGGRCGSCRCGRSRRRWGRRQYMRRAGPSTGESGSIFAAEGVEEFEGCHVAFAGVPLPQPRVLCAVLIDFSVEGAILAEPQLGGGAEVVGGEVVRRGIWARRRRRSWRRCRWRGRGWGRRWGGRAGRLRR